MYWKRCSIGELNKSIGSERMDYSDSEKKIIWAATVSGMGHHFFFQLMNCYEDMDAAFANFNPEHPDLGGIPTKVRHELARRRNLLFVDDLLEKWRGITLIPFTSPLYPHLLKEVADYPIVLYVRGKIPERETVAIVGTRQCTAYGKTVAQELGERLAQAGKMVVSGGARGIDTCAHRGAVTARGKTVAVFGCGVDVCYPAENRELFAQIVDLGGGLVSEYPPGTPPLGQHFPARNRIISGLARSLVVVESGEKSGAHITVRYALEQGREVYAVPGNIISPASKGTNKLIADGARPLVDYKELTGQKADGQSVKALSKNEQRIVTLLREQGRLSLDQLLDHTGFDISVLMPLLTILEIKGIMKKLPGNFFTV